MRDMVGIKSYLADAQPLFNLKSSDRCFSSA